MATSPLPCPVTICSRLPRSTGRPASRAPLLDVLTIIHGGIGSFAFGWSYAGSSVRRMSASNENQAQRLVALDSGGAQLCRDGVGEAAQRDLLVDEGGQRGAEKKHRRWRDFPCCPRARAARSESLRSTPNMFGSKLPQISSRVSFFSGATTPIPRSRRRRRVSQRRGRLPRRLAPGLHRASRHILK